MVTRFTQRALWIIQHIPEGKVMTYGKVARFAGNPRGARQISRLLHAMSQKHNLPWHRIINAQGKISLKPSQGFELQKAILESEGIVFSKNNTIDMKLYEWHDLPIIG